MTNNIPKGWKKVKLGEISIDISYGYTASAKSEPIGPKFLRITDIVPNRINWNTVPYCEISDKNYKKYKLEIGDIVIARTGATTGYNKIIKKDIESVFASYLIRYKINKDVADPFYVAYNLQSKKWYGFVENIIAGSAQPGANARQFADFEFYLPPLPEQRAIAEVLSSLDDKIDLLHRQNKTLEEMAMTIFRHYFIDNPDREKWEEVRLGDEFNIIMGQAPKGETYNDKKIGYPLFQGNADFGFRFPKARIYTTMPTKLVEPYLTLLSVRAPVGEVNMSITKSCIGRGVAAFEYKKNPSFHSYTFYMIKYLSTFFKFYDEEGTVFGAITKKDLSNFVIFKPPLNLILRFNSFAKIIDTKIINNYHQIRTLEQLRDTLLPKLMSGQIRVKM